VDGPERADCEDERNARCPEAGVVGSARKLRGGKTISLEKAWHEIERLRSDDRDLARMLAAAREQLEYQ
jgi:hypothetical protein